MDTEIVNECEAKIFSYQEVTEAAEKLIQRYMEQARGDEFGLYSNWAYGVYLSWMVLTAAFQKDGDEARMESLTRHDSGE